MSANNLIDADKYGKMSALHQTKEEKMKDSENQIKPTTPTEAPATSGPSVIYEVGAAKRPEPA
jgi:hypothetical protein